jgi:hypothetical protein
MIQGQVFLIPRSFGFKLFLLITSLLQQLKMPKLDRDVFVGKWNPKEAKLLIVSPKTKFGKSDFAKKLKEDAIKNSPLTRPCDKAYREAFSTGQNGVRSLYNKSLGRMFPKRAISKEHLAKMQAARKKKVGKSSKAASKPKKATKSTKKNPKKATKTGPRAASKVRFADEEEDDDEMEAESTLNKKRKSEQNMRRLGL